MNTTATTTANDQTQRLATFAPNAVYSVPEINMHFDIEFSSDNKTARLRDNTGYITEALEIFKDGMHGFIDPAGYMLPLSSVKRIQPAFVCSVCNETKQPEPGLTTGYGVNRETGAKTCFACIGIQDRQHLENMKPGEKTYLYLSGETVTNWPGTFSAPIHGMKVSRHNFGIKRRDFWFWVKYKEFHAYQIGEFTQIAHVRRTNRVWNPAKHKFEKKTV